MHRFDVTAAGGAFADVVDEALERSAKGHFDEAGVLDLADERKHFGAGALGAAGLSEPLRTAADDGGDVAPCLDVVDVCRFAVKAFLRGERRARMGAAREAFERGDESCFFATDKGPCALHKFDVEVEAAIEDVVAEEAVFAGLLDGAGKAANGKRILGAHVDDAFCCAHDVSANDHAFEKRMRVAFDLVAVHVGAGVALVGVADDVFDVGLGFGEEVPLVAGEEARAAAAAETCCLDLLDDSIFAAVDEDLVESLVAANGDVLLNVRWIDESAVAQDDLFLAFEKRKRVPRRDLRVALAVFHVCRNVVPLFDLAEDEVGRHHSAGDAFENAAGVVSLHAMEDDERAAGKMDANERLLKAGAEAADAGELHIEAAALNCAVEGVKELFRSVAAAAGSHAHRDARNDRHQFGKTRLTYRVECANVLNTRHHFPPPVRVLISRCKVRSFTWLRMW